MGFEGKRYESNRAKLRRAFHAALAVASLAGGPAASEELKMPPGVNAANKAVSKRVHEKAKISSWAAKVTPAESAKIPKAEDTEVIKEYLSFTQRLRGWHLTHEEEVVHTPGFDKFCEKLSNYCNEFAERHPESSRSMTFSLELLARITEIHEEMNRSLKPMTDMEHYHEEERWAVPEDGAGDCEDYVLLKMVRLIGDGIDPGYLHIMVVKDEKGEGQAQHACLRQ